MLQFCQGLRATGYSLVAVIVREVASFLTVVCSFVVFVACVNDGDDGYGIANSNMGVLVDFLGSSNDVCEAW